MMLSSVEEVKASKLLHAPAMHQPTLHQPRSYLACYGFPILTSTPVDLLDR